MPVIDDIRALLKADPRTRETIGKLCGIHPVNLFQFQAGNRSLPLPKLEKLVEILGSQIVVAKRARR